MSQIVTKFIQDGAITNAKVNASAGIQYSKLNLTDGIKNADVSSIAAIAYSKLNLAGNIQNSDISASAAIDASKIANGSVSNVEFQYLDGVTSSIQSQINAISSVTPNKETFVLSGTDITNQYIDLAQVAKTNSILFSVKGAGSLLEGASYDYSVSYTGGAGGKTRITFLNDLATGGNAALVATDVVQVNYQY